MLIYIAYIDWKSKRISKGSVLTILGISMMSVFLFPQIGIVERVAGGLIVSLPLFFIACIVPGSIGGGDIKLMAAAGIGLGISGIWQAFVIAVVTSGIYVGVLLGLKKADRKSEVALGPFLCLGILAVWLVEM